MKNLIAICFVAMFISFIPIVRGESIWNYYHPIGSSEYLTAKFDHSIEATTTNPYNGYLSLHFSGYGYNNPSEAFDAFYFFYNAGSSNWQPIEHKQGLGIAFDGNLVVDGTVIHYEDNISNNTDVNNVHNSLWQIVYNNDVGLYDGLNVFGFPIYKQDHEYDIVLFINNSPRIINFGFLDGGTYDNSGQVNIIITPIALGAVPEPPTIFLLITVLVLASIFIFRRKK